MEILNYPHEVLRFKTHPLTKIDKVVKDCATSMVKIMREEKGAGLSANQVGLPFSMFVVEWHDGEAKCFVNPIVKPLGSKRQTLREGCLSLPEIFLNIDRKVSCHIKAWDLNGVYVDETLKGNLARVVQHEMDHLNGVLIIDRASETQKIKLKKHLELMEMSSKTYPKPFPQEHFNEVLYAYTSAGHPIQTTI